VPVGIHISYIRNDPQAPVQTPKAPSLSVTSHTQPAPGSSPSVKPQLRPDRLCDPPHPPSQNQSLPMSPVQFTRSFPF
jgi:hypothetical protein